MDRFAALPPPLRWFFRRYRSSFWFRALFSAALFFVASAFLVAANPHIPHPSTPPALLELTALLALGSLAWGLVMSALLGRSMRVMRRRFETQKLDA